MTIERLDNVTHADLKLAAGHGARFGDAVNLMPLMANEFAAALADYPILFRRAEDGPLQAYAVLGLERDANLFLEGEGWNARYVPAAARRGPFALEAGNDGEAGVLVDLAHPRIAAGDAPGLPLFREHGGNAPALDAAIGALQTLADGLELQAEMDRLFTETGVVEPLDLTVTRASGSQVRFDGYLAVAEDRLAALDGASLERLARAGLLGPAYHAAASLANFRTLVALDAQKDG